MRRIPSLHLLLFVLTFLTTTVAGSLLQRGVNILEEPLGVLEGLPFSLTLMTILLSHELSHYFASKRHHTEATLPYFIPAPPFLSPIGTFGAFIKMKSPIVTRKALIDIGASGPIAGFLLSVIASVVGLANSSIVPLQEVKGGISLGDSLLFSLLSRLVLGVPPDSYDILLHPVALAGWLGLFVTSLNLIPIGQLDGGHIAFAFLGERHKALSKALAGMLLAMGCLAILQTLGDAKLFSPDLMPRFVRSLPELWAGWALWGGLMIALGLKHPPVIHWEVPLDGRRRAIGILSVIIFIITFMPSPFKLME
ncbi:MAG TPA: site-2 protease family protein [Thermodesulfovibrionales bacterium]|nr:site-2 protease family protein [Thermodesulfovibrionales bacterium]